jgi:hypothetical protein
VLGSSLAFCASAWPKAEQMIALQEPSWAVVGTNVTEPGESSVGLEVGLATETPSVCVLSFYRGEGTGLKATWTVDLIEAGTCSITARQVGDVEYEAAEARLSFIVHGRPVQPKGQAGRGVGGHSVSPQQRKAVREFRKRLKACKRDRPESKRKACEKELRKRYRIDRSVSAGPRTALTAIARRASGERQVLVDARPSRIAR